MTESLPSFEAKQLKLDHFKQQHSESFVIFWCGPQNSPTPCLHRILFEETSYSLGLMRGICPSPRGFVSLENFGPEAGSFVQCLCNLDGSGRSPVAHCCIKNETGTAGLTCPSCGCCPWIWSSVRILARSRVPPTTTSRWCCHICPNPAVGAVAVQSFRPCLAFIQSVSVHLLVRMSPPHTPEIRSSAGYGSMWSK